MHMPPDHRRRRSDERERIRVATGLVLLQQPRKNRGVVEHDRVGDRPRALVADLDLEVGAPGELLLAADLRDGRAQLAI